MRKTLLYFIVLLLGLSCAFAKQPGNFTRERLLKDLAALNTLPNWEDREAAFQDIFQNADPEDSPGRAYSDVEDTTTYLLRTLAPPDKELFITTLIGLLRRENAFEKTGAAVIHGEADEGMTDYVEDIGIAVMMMRDQRSIPALLDIIDRRGPIAEIARFGEASLGPSLDRLTRTPTTVGTEDEELRMDLTILLSEFMRPANRAKLQPQSIVKLKSTFQTLASDPSPFVRENTVRGLMHFKDDPEIKAVLTQLAQHDPATQVQKAATDALK